AARHRRGEIAVPPAPVERSAWSLRFPGRRRRDTWPDSKFGTLKSSGSEADSRPEDEMPSPAAPGVSGGWALRRSVTFLHVFLLASAGILFIGATMLGWLLTTSLERQALDDASTSLTQYVDGVLRPQLVSGDKLHISPHLPLRLKAQLRRQPDLLSVKVWRPDGTLVWTNRAPERIGRRFSSALLGDLGETIDKRRAQASISKLGGEEDAVEQGPGVDHVFEGYAPFRSAERRKARGAYGLS